MKRFVGALQTTLAREIALTGTGVHTGAPASIILSPAEAGTGIRFLLPVGDGIDIPATFRAVSSVKLCVVLSNGNGAAISTVEHLLAALRGLGVDNVLIGIDNAEVPIMDGSSKPFVEAIDEAGIMELDAPRRFLKILKPVRIDDGQATGELRPHNGFHLNVGIEFDTPLIGSQRIEMELNPGSFRQELARARTFGFMKDVESLWAAGLALGASLDNTIAIGGDRVMNREGLRFADEFVRHKALDALGDLALAGSPLLGSYRSWRGGHRLNALVLKALFADEEAWAYVDAPRTRRDVGHAESGIAIAAANYAADRS